MNDELYRVVHYMPKEFLLDGFGDKDDKFWVISIEDPFLYVIPSFDVLAVELRQIQIKGYDRTDGKVRRYDLFIRNNTSLCQMYPSLMTTKDVTVIEVLYLICLNTEMCFNIDMFYYIFIVRKVNSKLVSIYQA